MAGYGDCREQGGNYYDHGRSSCDRYSGDRDHRERQRGYGSDRRGPLTCFNYRESWHYVYQCPHPRRNTYSSKGATGDSRETSSPGRSERARLTQHSDVLESKVEEIGTSVAVVCQYVEIEQQKKAAKERRRAEKLEAGERAAAERAESELKKAHRAEKARKETERKEEIHKCFDIKMALRVGELRDEVRDDIR
ncbi:hypothetical protein CBR_g46591 [Chara braunii]|uniref:Uncharacterized protein n=1 Tax=Chara braunii TaxID=69332 RepID=A0A388M0U0_CHABU|nr:hypothetical protein CBR_g46591 [Chara braunii]|eukprot:GBG88102.1 hypothetical protein CBR_g46591 [Chara braunii]